MVNQEKLVYKDGKNIKVLRGKTIAEDAYFVEFQTLTGSIFRINKSAIITIKSEVGK